MIKANELRIGDWLKRDSQPDGFIVDANTIARIFNSGVRDEQPIPLTPEILKKTGFEKTENGIYHKIEFGSLCLCVFKEKIIAYVSTNSDGTFNHVICYIDSVHELQNLFSALTQGRKELEIVL